MWGIQSILFAGAAACLSRCPLPTVYLQTTMTVPPRADCFDRVKVAQSLRWAADRQLSHYLFTFFLASSIQELWRVVHWRVFAVSLYLQLFLFVTHHPGTARGGW